MMMCHIATTSTPRIYLPALGIFLISEGGIGEGGGRWPRRESGALSDPCNDRHRATRARVRVVVAQHVVDVTLQPRLIRA